MTEKAYYQQVVSEMTNGQYDDALWAMVWAKANGDDSKAKAGYIKHRLSELKTLATRESRAHLRALWRDAVRPLPKSTAFRWTLVLLAGLNVLYFYTCYHHGVGAGAIAAIAAAVGFNLLPLAAGGVVLWFWRRRPERALVLSAVVLLSIGSVFLLLNVVDATSQFSDAEQFTYSFNLPDGMPALLSSKSKLTGQQYQDAVEDFAAQWRQRVQDHVKAVHAAKVGGTQYWAGQFWMGFRTPYITALCRHVHSDPDSSPIKLRMSKDILEYEEATNGF